MEFAAYRIMHAALNNAAELTSELQSLPEHAVRHQYIVHALKVCRYFHQQRWISFGMLYETAPKMTPYLMDRMLDRLRVQCLRTILIAFRPTLFAVDVAGWLGYDIDMQEEREAIAQLLLDRGCVIHNKGSSRCPQISARTQLDCIASIRAFK